MNLGWLVILQNAIFLELTPEATSRLTQLAEIFLQECALFLKIVLEFIAILMIAVALVAALQKLVRRRQKRFQSAQQTIRSELGLSLALSLEFLLAADIVSTAVSPSWDAIARLAAITGIRTFLNFFLQREVRELQEMKQLTQENIEPEARRNDLLTEKTNECMAVDR